LTFGTQEKVAPPLIARFRADFRKVHNSGVKKCTEFFVPKISFPGKKFPFRLTSEFCAVLKLAQNCASFNTLFWTILNKFFQLLSGALLIFLEDKRSNKIETVQCIVTLFYKLILGFKAKPKTHEA
jgi:hypothetical protein